VTQDEEQEFRSCVVIREMTTRFHSPAQFRIQALNRVCCVDDPPHGFWKGVEWNDLAPVPALALTDGGIFLAPGAGVKIFQLLPRRFGFLGAIDLLQRRGDGFALFP